MKALRKNHGLGKGISSLLGNFDYDLNSEEVIAEAEKRKNEAVEELLEEKPETYDPKKLGNVGMEAVKEQVKIRMKMCGCDGKAE